MLAFALFIFFPASAVESGGVRKPVWAGRFYEADPSELSRTIADLTRKAQKSRVEIPDNRQLRALILPHAGYIYSGWTAGHACHVLQPGQFAKILLLGPDHRNIYKSAAICNVDVYETPLGRISLHDDTRRLRRRTELFESIPATADKEHSLEVVLPFLQHYLGKFQLVPVMVGRGPINALSAALQSIIDKNTLLVVSSDLSHYLAYTEAVVRDHETIDEIVDLKPKKLVAADNRACGKLPLLILTEIARRRHWRPLLLHYSNSGDTAGGRSRVVGYAAIAFFGDQSMDDKNTANTRFSQKQGQALVKLARLTIADKLKADDRQGDNGDVPLMLEDDCFQAHCGTFVTLKTRGKLRGCIGNLTSSETVLNSVRRNALNAAFHDPRFAALTIEELHGTDIEVSILSEPQPLTYLNGPDLIGKLRPHIDGVIIRKGHASATFLPQVWEQLPEPESFLRHLCLKAGLSSDAWQDDQLEVLTYQVQYFEEIH
jgi:AmmeMemoRadiSam system protein B/AmmeMemoRadiSam system protein A